MISLHITRLLEGHPSASELAILQLLKADLERCLSPEQIHTRSSTKLYELSIATVYRVLAKFERLGIVSSITPRSGKTFYHLRGTSEHNYAICTHCGCVCTRPADSIDGQVTLAMQMKFHYVSGMTIVYGVCAACATAPQR